MSRDDLSVVTLPAGLTVGELRHQTAVLRPLTGREELLLATTVTGVCTAERVTALLSRCLDRLGPNPVGPDQVRALTVGDREVLLLHLRSATIGDRIDCLLTCPDPMCGERIDVELRTKDLLLAPYVDAPSWREESFPAGPGKLRVRFRLPTGADQEAVAALADTDAEAAAAALLRRCLDRIEDDTGEPVAELAGETGAEVAARMAELDPQAEIRLRLECPACKAPIEVLFDTASFFFSEMAASEERLFEEIHTLAWYYHWGEDEILNLTARKRRRYLDLIAASLNKAIEGGLT